MIPFDESRYLAHALNLKIEEKTRAQQMRDWLPEHIVDAHSHSNLKEHVRFINPRALEHMLSTFPYFSIEDSLSLRNIFFPECDVRSLRFAKTFRGIDHRAANQYLLTESPMNDRIAVFGLPEDIEYTARIMQHPRASALKMYWSYVEPPAERIYNVFPREVLEAAQSTDIPVILHLPRMIVYSCQDLAQVVTDFPRLRISIAHLGSSKMVVPGLEDAYQLVSKLGNVVMDTSLNPSPNVVALALRYFGADRILFGSDEPLNLIRSVAYEHPTKGQRIITDYRYHWTDMDEFREYGHLATKSIHAHWQCLRAIKKAINLEPAEVRRDLKEKIFSRNAIGFFGF